MKTNGRYRIRDRVALDFFHKLNQKADGEDQSYSHSGHGHRYVFNFM